MFKSVLIANRGEIALRIQRACHGLGLKTIVVYSEADRDAPYVRRADQSLCIGPAAAGPTGRSPLTAAPLTAPLIALPSDTRAVADAIGPTSG